MEQTIQPGKDHPGQQSNTDGMVYSQAAEPENEPEIDPELLKSIQHEVTSTRQRLDRNVEQLRGYEERISVGLDSIQRGRVHAKDLELEDKDLALQSIKTVKYGYAAPFSAKFEPSRTLNQYSGSGSNQLERYFKERASSNHHPVPRTSSVADQSLSAHLVVSIPAGAKQQYVPKRIPREMLASVHRPATFVNPIKSFGQPSPALESQAALNSVLHSLRASRDQFVKTSVSPDKYKTAGGIFSSRKSYDEGVFRTVGDYGSTLSQIERTYDARSGLHQLTDLVKKYKSTCSTFHDGCPKISTRIGQLEASKKYGEMINPSVNLQNLYHVPTEVHRQTLSSLEKRNRCSNSGEYRQGLLSQYEKVDRLATIDRCEVNLHNIKARQQLGTLLSQKPWSARKPAPVKETAKDFKVPLSTRYSYTRSNVLAMALDRN